MDLRALLTRTKLSSWSGTTSGVSQFIKAKDKEHCCEILQYAKSKGLKVLIRGAGCTFGDAILNTDGIVIDITEMNHIEAWQPQTGVLRAEAGTSMTDILRLVLKDGWVVAAIPGSLAVTLGGAISNNVHGKDSCRRGNFGNYVNNFTLLTADGDLLEVSREKKPDLFHAVIGGLGLFGIIISAELQLVKIPSQIVEVETKISRAMNETLEHLEESSTRDYGQVWLDAFPQGKRLGRGFTKLARYVESDTRINLAAVEKSLTVKKHLFGILPARATWKLVRPLLLEPGIRFTNRLYYHKVLLETSAKGSIKQELFSKFYFFHNNIPDFYSVYRPPGFVEIQALLPRKGDPNAFTELIRMAQKLDITPVLSGMKRHLPDDFMISFSGEGYSISLDIPLLGRDFKQVRLAMNALFACVADQGGKVNLSKDECVPREMFRSMYPKYQAFWELKSRIDPGHLFISDMARRLFE